MPFSSRAWSSVTSGRFHLALGGLLLALALQAGADPRCHLPPDPLSGWALFNTVRTYTDIGARQAGGLRTGTLNARAAARWLQEELACAGLNTLYQPWQFRRFSLWQCRLVVDGEPVDCLPLWFPNATRVENLEIALSAPLTGKAAAVAVKGYQQDNVGVAGAVANAIAAGAQAVIAVNVAHQSLTSINAIDTTAETPQPVPVVVVGAKDAARLSAAKNVDTLEILGRDVPQAQTANLIARLPGPPRSNKLIVVSTPLNGWFVNGGERGPGLALFLGLARWAATTRPAAEFVFVATSGHELGEMGNRRFLDDADQLGVTPQSVTAWLHLGSSIATWDYTELGDGEFQQSGSYYANLDYNDPALEPLLTQYLAPVGHDPQLESADTSGELALIMDQGYKTFGFYGAFGKFHTEYDLADSTAPDLLEPVARSLAAIIDAIVAAP